jgi:hypothetical protein
MKRVNINSQSEGRNELRPYVEIAGAEIVGAQFIAPVSATGNKHTS